MPPASSTMEMRIACDDWCPNKYTMNSVNPMPTSGTISVPITKPLVFTRVTYSRLMMSQILRMGSFLDEDVV